MIECTNSYFCGRNGGAEVRRGGRAADREPRGSGERGFSAFFAGARLTAKRGAENLLQFSITRTNRAGNFSFLSALTWTGFAELRCETSQNSV